MRIYISFKKENSKWKSHATIRKHEQNNGVIMLKVCNVTITDARNVRIQRIIKEKN